MKSSDPAASDFARSGAKAAPARGKGGAFSAIGPSSPAIRLTIARAARPVKTFVIAVWSSCAFFKACRYNGATFASGQNR